MQKNILLEWPQVVLPLEDILKNKTLTKAMVKDLYLMYVYIEKLLTSSTKTHSVWTGPNIFSVLNLNE